ncbi:AAA family ATPase [Paracoccus jeotgali]|uniref:AAA family ATPase n=1 Tax=Paracoccus jeotgali TaxID=2065379 RepID=UPI0028B1193E|nr:AAA family ATPase [Paracoccus jeotgali]
MNEDYRSSRQEFDRPMSASARAFVSEKNTKNWFHEPRIIEPPLVELHRMRTPLEPGEWVVLDFFRQNLRPEWEIYIQPHLNGLRPDFVLLNPNVGIAVFEVKNWDLGAIRYFPKKIGDKRTELWGDAGGKEFSKEIDNPFRKIALYKERIFNIYCPRLQRKAGFAAITGGVIFPSATRAEGRQLQQSFLGESEQKTASTYLPVSGREELFRNDLSKVFPEASRDGSNLMTPALANDLRGWLAEPDFSREQREPLPLDNQQRRLAETRTSSGFRRIKGPAGSGKSLVLAARAARLASEGKSVLVVTYNITLWHYLRDMIRRNISHRDAMKNIEFTHFHDWCKDLCVVTGFGAAYSELFDEVHKTEAYDLSEKEKRQRIGKLIGPILDHDVPSLAMSAALSDDAPRYDAILVDEAQDYLPLWWSALKNCRAQDGEMLLVADTTQDIYGKAQSWTDDAMSGAGFTGDWARLEGSYRLPREALQTAQDFARKFLPKEKIDLAEVSQGSLDVEPCTLRWIQCPPEEAKRHCINAVLAMMRETGPQSGTANADITFICNEIAFGKSVTDELDTYSNIRTVHTFEADRMEQARRKMAFWKGDARVKATTLHSFKGWESRLLVVHVGHAIGADSLASIYVALTRLKRSPAGSWLTVVCSAPELAHYGGGWPS